MSHDSSNSDNQEKTHSAEATEASPSASIEKNLDEELEKVKNEYLYLRAEFDNFRKQSIKERSDLVKYGAERLIIQLLNVVDVFQHALDMEVTPENLTSFKEGMVMTSKEFDNVLKNFGVESIDPKGEAFNPSVHEALGSEPSTEVAPGHIVKTFKSAYKLHDKIIRPAQVIVATEPTEAKD